MYIQRRPSIMKFLKINRHGFFAFTLAEVLITLGIIGVVAALTIPTLLQNQQKQQAVAGYKKMYTNIAQAVKLSENDNGPNKDWDWGSYGSISGSFNTYWAPYLKITKICTSDSDCGYKSYHPWSPYGLVAVDPSSRVSLILSDGSFLMIKNFEDVGTPAKAIFIDINGPKNPNLFGKDTFRFYLDQNKGLMPYGYDSDLETINNNCSAAGVRDACAAKIMMDGWQIKDDYPW